MSKKKHFQSTTDVATEILNQMFGKDFGTFQLEEVKPIRYHKTPDEMIRKFFTLQDLHLLVEPQVETDIIFEDLFQKNLLQALGTDAAYFLYKKMHKDEFNDKEFYYLNTICRDQTTILAHALGLEPCLFNKEVLCKTADENWNSIREYCKNNIPKDGRWHFNISPALEMVTEFDLVTCLLGLIEEKDPAVYSFISNNNLTERLHNYWHMLNWLFTDCPFDNEVGTVAVK